MAVIGMGKLGGRELNYSSDVDIMFVTAGEPEEGVARRILQIARLCFRVDVDLRPEGRAGPLTRSLDSYGAYWERWAATWEFQALLKARAVAGDAELGHRFETAAIDHVWGRNYSADELAAVRSMKARTEGMVAGRGLLGREIKRGQGGIRDIEFAVQLLQLVHGGHDPGIRDRSTLGALAELAAAGYVTAEDAGVLAESYRFLRTVEHRLQLVEEDQTHSIPTDPDGTEASGPGARLSRRRLAPGHLPIRRRRCASVSATCGPSTNVSSSDPCSKHSPPSTPSPRQPTARQPTTGRPTARGVAPGPVMSAEAVTQRLAAFGFSDATRTRAAVEDLAGGLTRSSRLMAQMLPLVLDWLSLSPDPDLGLLGLRNLVVHAHQRSLLVTAFRESPEAARRLCLLLGSGRTLVEAIERNPELIAVIGDDVALAPTDRDVLVAEAGERLQRNDDESWRRGQLVRLRQDQYVRIAARDLLDVDDVVATGRALTGMSERFSKQPSTSSTPPCRSRSWGWADSAAPRCRTPATSTSSSSTTEPPTSRARQWPNPFSISCTDRVPAQRVATIDLGLRPEGNQGRLARDLHGLRGVLRPLGRDLGAPGTGTRPGRRRRPGPRSAFHGPARRIRLGPASHRRGRGRHQEDEGAHRARTDPVPRRPAVPFEAGTRLSVRHRMDRATAPAPPPHSRDRAPTAPSRSSVTSGRPRTR